MFDISVDLNWFFPYFHDRLLGWNRFIDNHASAVVKTHGRTNQPFVEINVVFLAIYVGCQNFIFNEVKLFYFIKHLKPVYNFLKASLLIDFYLFFP